MQVDLDQLHFCKTNKVKYRKHLTVGVLISALASIVGIWLGNAWLTHLGVGANTITSIIWIWE